MSILTNPLMDFFKLIHKGILGLGISNLSLAYFLDIFIFTAIIKFVILPFTIAQTRSTVKMGELQPKMKELQEKYKNDPQKLAQKQQELYKETGVNPLAGCLPLLIQFPIFMAMYYVIYNYTGFNNVPFLWVKNLAGPDVAFSLFKVVNIGILPLISGLTTYLAGIMIAPKGDDPSAKTQKMMNIYMAVFFIWMSGKFKAALVLYWTISNLIQMLQQYFIVNRIRKHEEAKLAK